MNQPMDEWKTKYFDTLENLERKEKHWQSVESALKRSISRLSFIGDGMDSGLDQRLEDLRNRVRGEKDMANLQRMVDAIASKAEKLRHDEADAGGDSPVVTDVLVQLLDGAPFQSSLKPKVKLLRKALKKERFDPENLEQFKSLIAESLSISPEKVKETASDSGLFKTLFSRGGSKQKQNDKNTNSDDEARTEQDELPLSGCALAGEMLTHLIDRLPRNSETAGKLDGLARKAQDADSKAVLEQLATELADIMDADNTLSETDTLDADTALLQLIERLDLPSEMQARANALKRKLSGSISEKDLPDLLDEMVYLVGQAKRQAEEARQEVERFLLQLTDRLQALDQELEGVDQKGSEIVDQNRQFSEEVQTEVSNIHTSVAAATNLDELKLTISERLTMIQERLRGHMDEEARQKEGFNHCIIDLKSKIGEMEQESVDLKLSIEEARAEAFRDALTGLNNRHAFDLKMAEEYARWKRYGFSMSLIIVDVDHFKKVNDTYGHQAGDKVLRVIGDQLIAMTRESDFPARYGGEEFVVLLPEIDLESARAVAEKIRKSIGQKPFHSEEQQVDITVSCGISEFREGDTTETAFERADSALYLAKRGGRNRCHVEGEK